MFACKHASHDKFPRKKHVLVCAEHCDTDENKTLFEDYKERFILKRKKPLPNFTREMKLSFHVHAFSAAPSQEMIVASEDDNTDVDNAPALNDNADVDNAPALNDTTDVDNDPASNDNTDIDNVLALNDTTFTLSHKLEFNTILHKVYIGTQ